MEHALGVSDMISILIFIGVLILIVMEHALGVKKQSSDANDFFVLILIVMEHALGAAKCLLMARFRQSLNPYCNGTCSRS